jgi:hypothetical protein
LRRLLAAVDRDELAADEPAARRLLQRLEVAANGFEMLAEGKEPQ